MTSETYEAYQERLWAILQSKCYRKTELGELFEVTPYLFCAMQFFLAGIAELRPPSGTGLKSNTVHVGHFLGKPVFLKLSVDPDGT